MASRGSRLRKLLKAPDIFFRDMFLKQFPSSANRFLKPSDVNLLSDANLSPLQFPGSLASALQGIPILRMERGLRFPLYGIPAYAGRTVANRLTALDNAMVVVEGAPPWPTSVLRQGHFRTAFTNASYFSLYTEIDDALHVTVFSFWDITSDVLTARSDDLPIKRAPMSALWSGEDIIPADSTPNSLTPHGPIDAVYTWVNSADPHWRSLFRDAGGSIAIDQDRFGQTDELKYSLRSLFMHAPWINNVYILSNCTPPDWFEPRPNIHWVDHNDVIPKEYLPTFNSNVIESFIWRMDGLSEQFIYLNDDFFLGHYFRPEDFFCGNGCSVARFHANSLVPSMLHAPAGSCEDWEEATVNAAEHFHALYGVFPGELHEHAPYTVKRSIAQRMEKEFEDALTAMRSNRFRRKTDVPPLSFLYPHYARWTRFAHTVPSKCALISQHNFRTLLRALKAGDSYDFYCINDGGDSSQSSEFTHFKVEFGELMYPFKSPCERIIKSH